MQEIIPFKYEAGQDLVVNSLADPDDPPDEVIWTRRRGRMHHFSVADVLERVAGWKSQTSGVCLTRTGNHER